MSSNDALYQKTLGYYNDPEFAQQYVSNIADRFNTRLLTNFLPLVPKGGRILDAGSAAGRDSAYMQEHGYEVTGIDYSHELTRLATSKYPSSTFVQGDFTELPFTSGSFDAIYCNAALVHLPSMALVERALHEFYRVLQGGGHILLCTKARLAGQPETAVKKDALSNKDRFFRYQDETEFLELCNQAGFTVLRHLVFNEKDQQHLVRRDENWLLVVAQKPFAQS